MAHRYLYYVDNDSVITDFDYDRLEAFAKSILPHNSPVITNVGSSLPQSYTAHQKAIAKAIARGRPTQP